MKDDIEKVRLQAAQPIIAGKFTEDNLIPQWEMYQTALRLLDAGIAPESRDIGSIRSRCKRRRKYTWPITFRQASVVLNWVLANA